MIINHLGYQNLSLLGSKCIQQKRNNLHIHATRFFDGITSFFSMLHFSLKALQNIQ